MRKHGYGGLRVRCSNRARFVLAGRLVCGQHRFGPQEFVADAVRDITVTVRDDGYTTVTAVEKPETIGPWPHESASDESDPHPE